MSKNMDGFGVGKHTDRVSVGEELKALCYDEHVYTAGTLHDIIEDCSATIDTFI